jgi:hypothetical protein
MAEQELTASDSGSGRAAVAHDGEPGRLPSLIERVVRLASLYDPATGCSQESTWTCAPAAEASQESLRSHHQSAFAARLVCSPAQQPADLEAHIRDTGHEARLLYSTESYRPLVPSTPAEHERHLFFIGLGVVLVASS